MSLALASILMAVTLTGCKIVKTQTQPATASAGSDASEAGHVDQVLADTYDAKLLPLIAQNALTVADLRRAVTADLDATGKAHGNRGAGAGAAWNFAVKGQGTVIAANLESRARKADLDTDGDGAADVTLQLGPVINGTALRDLAPFYDFGQFRDQIEFAKLARAINDKASAALTLPEGDLVGRKLNFLGAVTLKKPTDPFVVTAVTVGVAP
ncbi:DUF2291 family protein [bacterium]|nr:DUF2291 family protein [bacterium]